MSSYYEYLLLIAIINSTSWVQAPVTPEPEPKDYDTHPQSPSPYEDEN